MHEIVRSGNTFFGTEYLAGGSKRKRNYDLARYSLGVPCLQPSAGTT